MVIIPKEKPVIENLNSYYLDIDRLLEHYQGELGSGGVYFKSTNVEGIVFFDKDELLGGIYKDKEKEVQGKDAIELLINSAKDENFRIDIFSIPSEKVYFWANLPNSRSMYKDLSSEFTALDGLIRKMQSEGLTGYIDVNVGDGEEGGKIFFVNGEIIDDSYCDGKEEVKGALKTQEYLVNRTKEVGGVFDVFKITPQKENLISLGEDKLEDIRSKPEDINIMNALEELMQSFEEMIKSEKVKVEFSIALKKVLINRAEEYPFLDPFAGEFEYSKGKITFTGSADRSEFASAIIDVLNLLAQDLGLRANWDIQNREWFQKYSDILTSCGVRI